MNKPLISEADLRLPAVRPDLRIGLFGGSFDPPHEGHRAVSLAGLRALGLDQVWWLVSPRNPLKPKAPSADLERRMAAARALADHPRIKITGIEAALGTTFTAETLERLERRLTDVWPVWMMGADNLATFHHWRDWRAIAAHMPIAVFNRPDETLKALASPAACALRRARIPESAAATLAGRPAPAWVFLSRPRVALSSTALRAKRAHATS